MEEFIRYPLLNTQINTINIEVLENALFTGDQTWHHPNIVSPFNRLFFIIDGNGRLENEADSWPLQPGYMYLIPAGSCYTYTCTDFIHKFYIHFNITLFPGTDLFCHLREFQEMPCPPALMETLQTQAAKESLEGVLCIKAILWKIIFDFFQQGSNIYPDITHFEGFYRQISVLNYIENHLSASLRISDLALTLNVPIHQLSRHFKRDTGYGLKEYIEQMLLQKARHLLLHTSLSIGEIADALGFADAFYFSRFFKKAEHISPREYRKQRF